MRQYYSCEIDSNENDQRSVVSESSDHNNDKNMIRTRQIDIIALMINARLIKDNAFVINVFVIFVSLTKE